MNAQLHAIATAVPPTILDQETAADLARDTFADRFDDFDRIERVFRTSGIRKRHVAQPLDWYRAPHGWSDRNVAYLAGAEALFAEATERALQRAGLPAAAIDTVVTVSSTGIATPSIEARAAERLGLRPDVLRVPVFGHGCGGGIAGLGIAGRLAEARPGSLVLLVAVELCSLSFRLDKLTKANIVATALFGDGAAACLLSTDGGGLARIGATGQHTWPGTLGIMGWDIDETGFGVIFDRAIPPFAAAETGAAVAAILRAGHLAASDIDRYICHPGGAKVIEALEQALPIEAGALAVERAVLADFGNMSAPTALFVLERMLAEGAPGRSLAMAMGPGFSLSTAVLETGP
ncbi:type III polyketide synthase [Methylobrevis pamukkalensis]|uniref:Alpha-pyrone synthesis polyketide synthase-like Pks11 n=1 Tax=Methylobrevis pamukkalensis TaxID=1439726 RepID=A0A1E3H6A6_9HYPH|nr:type III polyketide synthase [Methylobrevis pamukkalensis]ODN71852.1 Alpha-pyrone synthesis polyketide synthase-like Pks11 [Methylobrevis pamukkalensis]